jgi:hypothetical protein
VKVFKAIGGVLVFLVILITFALAYSTKNGFTTWWFWSGGSVTVDGVRSGYLHRSWDRAAVIITRTDSKPSQSYLVWVPGKKFLIHCGEWHAPRLPAFPIGDVNPPCSVLSNGSNMPTADNPVDSTLIGRPGSVEFYTVQGKKVTASW